ncbi:MAG: GGDEF domain-containing protein [Burkholderiales bacterium]
MSAAPVDPLKPVDIARAALRNMADRCIPPTPENFTREYRIIAGLPPVEWQSPEMVEMVQAMIDLVSHTASNLATGVNRFHDETKPMLANVESTQEREFASLLRSFTAATLSLHQTVDTARQELTETRQRLAEVTRELERTVELARTDPLTGQWNRRGMDEIITHEIARTRRTKEPFSIAILDVDHFKKVNDDYGHVVGDQALMHLVAIAKSSIRESDVICRYGGEEFVVVLPGANVEGARYVIDRMRVRLENTPLPLNNQTLTIRFSAGVAEVQPGEAPAQLLERADRALHEAKHTGRNRVVAAGASARR